MPSFNQKGPMGEGPMTGRKMGRCTNYGAARRNQINQENENAERSINDDSQERGFVGGLGRRIGRGMGNGMGNGMGQNRGGRGMGRSGGGGDRGTGRRNRFGNDY